VRSRIRIRCLRTGKSVNLLGRDFGLLARQRTLLGEGGLSGILLFLETLGQEGVEFLGVSTGLDPSGALEGLDGTLALKTLGGDEPLDLRGLGGGFLTLLLNTTTDDVLADIIILGQVEERSDLGGSLGSETAGADSVGETFDLVVSLLDDDKVENRKISADDATSDGLSLALTSLALTVARVTLLEKKTDTLVGEDTLFHGETLLVVTTRDSEDVSLEIITQVVSLDFVADTLVEEVTKLAVIFDVEQLLAASGWVSYVELHGG
jgi:hypothetical protein